MAKGRALTDAAADPMAKKESGAALQTRQETPAKGKRRHSKLEIAGMVVAGAFILGVIGGLYLGGTFRFRLWS